MAANTTDYIFTTAELCILSTELAGLADLSPQSNKLVIHTAGHAIGIQTSPPFQMVIASENTKLRAFHDNPEAFDELVWSHDDESITALRTADGWLVTFDGTPEWGSRLFEALLLTRPCIALISALMACLRRACFNDNVAYEGDDRTWQEEQISKRIQSWRQSNMFGAWDAYVLHKPKVFDRMTQLEERFTSEELDRAKQSLWQQLPILADA